MRCSVIARSQVAHAVVAVGVVEYVACGLTIQRGRLGGEALGVGLNRLDGGALVAIPVLGDLALRVHGLHCVAHRLGKAVGAPTCDGLQVPQRGVAISRLVVAGPGLASHTPSVGIKGDAHHSRAAYAVTST